MCAHVRIEDRGGPRVMPLDAALLERVQQVTRQLGQDWLRGVAVAVKDLPPTQGTYAVADETGLTLVGHIAFLDPRKESAAPALKALAGHGIRVKVLTGDNEQVARNVSGLVGLPTDNVLLGSQIEACSASPAASGGWCCRPTPATGWTRRTSTACSCAPAPARWCRCRV